MKLPSSLLNSIQAPKDLKGLTIDDLSSLSQEVRAEIVQAVAQNGGHIGASLSVVELTLALHHIFDSPKDKIIWDIGHQCYAHKIVTGRRKSMSKLRQKDGLSGFTNPQESEHDVFGSTHAGSGLSAAHGFAAARDCKGEDHHVIVVIDDEAIDSGIAFEALNNIGASPNRLIVILNQNDTTDIKCTSGIRSYLSHILSLRPKTSLAQNNTQLVMPLDQEPTVSTDHQNSGVAAHGDLFEELGFTYVGPLDGHSLNNLLPSLKNVRDRVESGPILVHVVTTQGKGYLPAEVAKGDKFYGTTQFNINTGVQQNSNPSLSTFKKVFGKTLCKAAEQDDRVVAISPNLGSSAGLDGFARRFPDRYFNVGMADQHAITFATGLAREGMKPYVSIYSSFLQRTVDQVINEMVVQNLPVRLIINKAGLSGGDFPGYHDICHLRSLPHMVFMAPSDEAEFQRMLVTSLDHNGPLAIRYPDEASFEGKLAEPPEPIEIGKGQIIRKGSHVGILTIGTAVHEALRAAEKLSVKGLSTTVADARFVSPLDEELVLQMATEHDVLLTVEEGAKGGFGAAVLDNLANGGLLESGLKVRSLAIPNTFVPRLNRQEQLAACGLSANHIVDCAIEAFGEQEASPKIVALAS